MSDRVLPSNVDYTKILPLAVESRSRRRSFFPTNGQSFTSNGNNIIRIDVAASAFLDPKHSYLRFKYKNDTAQTCGFDFGGGHGFIRRLRIEQAGNVLTDVNHYNKLLSAIILPCQGGIDSVAHRSITEGQRFANARAIGTSMAPTPAADISGAIVNTPANSSEVVTASGGANENYTFSIPLMNGLLGTAQDKMVPLQMLGSSPLTIEIELADGLDIGSYGGFVADASYTISDVRYIAQLVEVGPEVDAQLRMVQEVSGGKLVLNGVDYTHFSGNISAQATGVQTINVPARRKSLKSLFFVGASQTYAGAGAGSHSQSYNLSYGGNLTMTDYQIKIGSVVYPPTPVDCQFNGPAGTTGFTRGEALSELAKCWGSVSSAHGTGSLSTLNYAVNSGNAAEMPQDPGGALACVSYEFAPFAMDLESFQRTALESGVNTSDRSLPISLMLNIGGGIVQEAMNIDAYVAYDSLYFIDGVGNIRVSM
tara:strand:- start:1127 stop:2569 length:1443 start_codon:yes stop_codon:yes gene_type:complete